MNIYLNHRFRSFHNCLRLFPYAALGFLIFASNSDFNLSYLWRGYIVLLEAQLGIVVIYFLMAKIAKISKQKIRLADH